MLTFEFEKPKYLDCNHCGGKSINLTRFVYEDGNAYAVYYASFSDNHPDKTVSVVVSLGDWGEGTTPEQRVAFPISMRSNKGKYEVMLTEPDESQWKDSKILGRFLSRKEALAHPLKNQAFHITDHMVIEDEELKKYLDKE